MHFDDVPGGSTVKKVLEAGEREVGRAVTRLLSSERVTNGLASLLGGAAGARKAIDARLQQALHAANLPSRDDVAALRRRLDERETLLDGLAEKVDAAPGRGGRAR